MSELISSRTWRAFSRAAVTARSTESSLSTSKMRASTSVPGLDGGSGDPRHAQRREQTIEVPAIGVPLAIEAEIEADVHQPGRVLGPFEIAADPVERVGDA